MISFVYHVLYWQNSRAVVFNLFGRAVPQGCVPVTRGTLVHLSVHDS